MAWTLPRSLKKKKKTLYVFQTLQLIYYITEIILFRKVKCHTLEPQILSALRSSQINLSKWKKTHIADMPSLLPDL